MPQNRRGWIQEMGRLWSSRTEWEAGSSGEGPRRGVEKSGGPGSIGGRFLCGTPVVSVPLRVTYPLDGGSHFDLLRDNPRLSWMQTRLFCGMLLRLPGWLLRKVFGNHT